MNKLNTLLKTAAQSGVVSPDALQSIAGVPDIGTQIQDALGVPADAIEGSEVFLLTVLLDDSGSIRFVQGNTEAVRDGHNLVLDALKASKAENDILVHATTLNRGVVYPYATLPQAPKLDSSNYNPNGGTPLYDQAIVVLATVLAKEEEFRKQGVPVRTATLILSDGHDEGSRKCAADVKNVVGDMLRRENHIIAAMGVDDGYTDFRQVFTEMGVRPEWILTPGNNPSEIRKAFQVFSKSSVAASKGAAAFSKMGGFAA
jgi:hypothetical protein